MAGESSLKVKDREKELGNVGAIKVVCMLLVVFGHSIGFWSGEWFPVYQPVYEFPGERLLSTFVSGCHIYTFTFLSGFLFAYKMSGGGYRDYKHFILNKVKRLLVPYIFVTLVWVAPVTGYFYRYDIATLAKMYILGINPSQLWYLLMLFDVLVLSWPLYSLFVRRPWFGAAAALVAAVAGTVLQGIVPNVFCILSALQNMPFFFLGIMLWENEKFHEFFTKTISWKIWVPTYLLLCLGVTYMNESGLLVEWGSLGRLIRAGTRFALSTVGMFAVYTGMQKLLARWEKAQKKLSRFSKLTFPVYLFHQQVIYIMIALLNGVIGPYLHAAVNFISALAVSGAISMLLLRSRRTRVLIGEK